MYKIYLAGPIKGRNIIDVVSDWREKEELFGSMGYKVLSPLTGMHKHPLYDNSVTGGGYNGTTTNNHAIFSRDKCMVQRCDIIFADLVYADQVSIGTVMELAWANLLGKHIVISMPKNSIHEHAFVLECTNIIFNNTQDAIDYFKDLISNAR